MCYLLRICYLSSSEYEGYPGDVVKQADVVLLHYPLGMDMPEDVQARDLDFYSEVTDIGGPAMTWVKNCLKESI